MKMYLVKSYDNSGRYTMTCEHGLFEDKKSAQNAIPKIWSTIFKNKKPTLETENEWVKFWDGYPPIFGLKIAVIEVEINKIYEDIDPAIYNPDEERLKEIK